MQMLIHSKQIKKLFATRVRVANFAGGSSNTITVTTPITTALSTAGFGGISVAVLPSTTETTNGVITTAPTNVALLYNSTTKIPLLDASGNEVYGRITESSSVYTLSYYVLINGVETAYTATGINIDFEFGYRFDFKDLPTDAIISQKSRNIADDPTNQNGIYTTEVCSITGTNTIANLAHSNIQTSTLTFYVNGQAILNTQGISSTGSGVVTVAPLTLGYAIETTDVLTATYFYY